MEWIAIALGFLLINAPAACLVLAWVALVRRRAEVRTVPKCLMFSTLLTTSVAIVLWYAMPGIARGNYELYERLGWIGVYLSWLAILGAVGALVVFARAQTRLLVLAVLSSVGARLLWVMIGFYRG